MIKFIFLLLILVPTTVYPIMSPKKTVTGQVESFDDTQVTLSGRGYKFKVPRNSISSKNKLERGATATATFASSPVKKAHYP